MAYIIRQSPDKKAFLVSQDEGETFAPVDNIGVSVVPLFKYQDAVAAEAIGLVQRTTDAKRYPDCWDIPGGRLDPGWELSASLVWQGLAKEMASELVVWGVNHQTRCVEVYWPDLPELTPVPTELHRRLSRKVVGFYGQDWMDQQRAATADTEEQIEELKIKPSIIPRDYQDPDPLSRLTRKLDRQRQELTGKQVAMEKLRGTTIDHHGKDYGLTKVPAKITCPKKPQVYLDLVIREGYHRVSLPMYAVLDNNKDFTALELVGVIEQSLPTLVQDLQLADIETRGELKERADNFLWRRTALIDFQNRKIRFSKPGHPSLYSDHYSEDESSYDELLRQMFTSSTDECQLVPKLKLLTSPLHEFGRDYIWPPDGCDFIKEVQVASGTRNLLEENHGRFHRKGDYFWKDSDPDDEGTLLEDSGPDYGIRLR